MIVGLDSSVFCIFRLEDSDWQIECELFLRNLIFFWLIVYSDGLVIHS
jgi:hypothetical protein